MQPNANGELALRKAVAHDFAWILRLYQVNSSSSRVGFPMPEWSREETIILLYFTSRGLQPKSIRALLQRRGYDRSIRAIEHKIANTTRDCPQLRPGRGKWDLKAVDQWIDDLLCDHLSVNRLIYFSFQDAEDVALVSIHQCAFG